MVVIFALSHSSFDYNYCAQSSSDATGLKHIRFGPMGAKASDQNHVDDAR